MPANKKKRKPAANPARGFATVSQPSKPKDVDDDESATKSSIKSLNENGGKAVANQLPPISQPGEVSDVHIQDMTPEQLEAHLEQSELVGLLEKYGARSKQDVSRQVNRLETERRQLRLPSQSHRLATASWYSNDTMDSLLSLHAESLTQATPKPRNSSSFPSEEVLLFSLWTLKHTLTALNLPDVDTVVEHVLRMFHLNLVTNSDYIWGLAEALEWYAVHGKKYNFPGYDDATIASGTKNQDPAITDDKAGALNGSNKSSDAQDSESVRDTNEDSTHPENIERDNAVNDELSDLPSSGSDDDDPALFSEKYCRLQTALFRIEQRLKRRKVTKLSTRRRVLITRIDRLLQDPLFDEYSAKMLWQPRLHDLEIEAAQEAQETRRQARSKVATQVDVNSDEVDEEVVGVAGMFSEANEESPLQASSTSQSIQILDFGTWSGAQPKKILEDACASVQADIRVRFFTISSSSYSTRQRLELTIPSTIHVGKQDSFAIPESLKLAISGNDIKVEMISVAAKTPAQAESYLSTIMLFLLSTMHISDQKHYQRLPPVWRNMYQRLIDEQKELTEREDVADLRALRAVLNKGAAEAGEERQSTSDHPRLNSESKGYHADRLRFNNHHMDADLVKEIWTAKSSSPAFQTMLLDRQQLPVYQYKQHVLEGIQHNQVVIICADTGAGKSTQIPSFFLEHELSQGRDCRIVVTQPRRISAISLARRVSRELGEGGTDIGTDRSLVGYAIRLESKVSQATRITYATTGVLLRMLESSSELEQIDCLILDEVHERSMDLDLLFIALRKLLNVRANLKIVLMSATVDARKFSAYFGGAPIIDIPGRTFPVEVKFLEDAVEETLPLRRGQARSKTGQRDNTAYLDSDSDSSDADKSAMESLTIAADAKDYSASTRSIISEMDEYRIDFELVADVAVTIATDPGYHAYSSAILIFMPGIAEIRRLQSVLLSREVFAQNWVVHLLHSSFSTEDLEKAFIVPSPGQRKIVISTNIAETGVTIPDVTAVIDTCKEKIMRFDERRQVSKLREGFISRSSARQRKGRAARVREGICFHLVTRSRYHNSMLEQHVPEMLRLSLQDAILRIKVWNLGSIEETLAAAIDPPTMKNVRRAVSKLKDAGALSPSEELTMLGRQLSKLPLEVVLGKLAIYGIIFKCLDSVLTVIAALSSKSPFQISREANAVNHRAAFARGDSDLITTLNAYEGWCKAREAGTVHQYCRKQFLNHNNLSAIEDQKGQLLINLVDAGLVSLTAEERESVRPSRPGRGSARGKQGFVVPARYNAYEHDSMLCTIFAVACYPRILAREGRGWRNVYSNQQMSLASSSINRAAEKPPKWLCYLEATQSKSGALTVLETSRIPEAALVSTIGGDASFKFFSGVVDIDSGKLRFSLGDWRQVAALKAIRERVQAIVSLFLASPGTTMSSQHEVWMQSWVRLVTGQSPQSS